MIILWIVLWSFALYNVIAMTIKLPKVQIARAKQMMGSGQKTGWLTTQLSTVAEKVAPHIVLSVMAKTKLQKALNTAKQSITPEQFTANRYLQTGLPLIAIPVLLTIHPLLSVLAMLISVYLYRRAFNVLVEEGNKRQQKVEQELLKFVMYMTGSLKTQRNLIAVMEQYQSNFNTPLTEELTYTLSDMRTGSYEQALLRMAVRNNSEAVNRLVQGMIATLSGNDMSQYYEQLRYELQEQWKQSLKKQALEQEPKITRMSMLLFVLSVVTVFTILITGLTSSNLLMGGI